jgi:hypothetical protein
MFNYRQNAMRSKNPVRTERAQLSLSDSTSAILEQLADLGILGKTKAEIATRIVTDWIWNNEDRLLRQGISLRQSRSSKEKENL